LNRRSNRAYEREKGDVKDQDQTTKFFQACFSYSFVLSARLLGLIISIHPYTQIGNEIKDDARVVMSRQRSGGREEGWGQGENTGKEEGSKEEGHTIEASLVRQELSFEER